MHRLISRLVPLVALSLILTGCSKNSSTATTVTQPSSLSLTDSFTGILTLNGAATHPFTVTGVGIITASLTTLTPDAARPVGLSLGTWSGSTCQIILTSDASIQGSVVTGQSTTVGTFCVRIYDAQGTVAQPETYTIEVTHQ